MPHENLPSFPFRFLAACAALAWATLPSASDPPHSLVNPQSGDVETATVAWADTRYDVHHVTNHAGCHCPDVVVLGNDDADDRGPRIEIEANGDTWVVWWRDQDTDRVLLRGRDYATGTWSDERVVSDPDEGSRRPAMAHDGSAVWIAYEYDSEDDTGIGVLAIPDEPDPIPLRTALGTTPFDTVDLRVHALAGHLWVTWVDSSTDVAWSEYDGGTGTWGAVEIESYAADSVANARKRIESEITGP